MMQQGSPEWFAQRLGKVTASRVSDVIAKTKYGYSASRSNYLAQLVAERLTLKVADSFTSPAMQHGTETEPMARMAYEAETGQIVTEVGLIDHPSIGMAAASPDGLVGDDGLVEIKCPNTSTHIATLLAGKAPSNHLPQIQWQLACTGKAWCDFVSYDPRMPEDLRLFIFKVQRVDEYIGELEKEVDSFLKEVDNTVSALGKLRG